MDGRPATLDNGFNVIARDLDRAFALGLSPNQAVIVNMIREQSWDARRQDGQRRPAVPVKVNVTHLARDTGLNRSRLSTALKGLVAGRILAETPDGFLIEKDYRKWLTDDAPAEGTPATHARFTATELRYIRAAKSSAKGGLDKQPATVAKRNSEVLQNATPDTDHCCETQHQLLRNATPAVADCNSAIKEDAPARSGEGGEDGEEEAGGRASSPIPPRPKEFDDLCREADADPALRSGAFGPKLRGAWGQDGELRRLWPDIPLATWRAALATLAGKPADKMQPRFYLGIVKKMPAPPPAGMRPSQAPPPSRSAVYDVYEAPRRPSSGRK